MVIIIDLILTVGLVILFIFLMPWLTRQLDNEIDKHASVGIIVFWFMILIIAKNLIFYIIGYDPFNPVKLSLISISYFSVDFVVIILYLRFRCSNSLRNSLVLGTILLVMRRMLEVFAYYIGIIIIGNQIYFQGFFILLIYL